MGGSPAILCGSQRIFGVAPKLCWALAIRGAHNRLAKRGKRAARVRRGRAGRNSDTANQPENPGPLLAGGRQLHQRDYVLKEIHV